MEEILTWTSHRAVTLSAPHPIPSLKPTEPSNEPLVDRVHWFLRMLAQEMGTVAHAYYASNLEAEAGAT